MKKGIVAAIIIGSVLLVTGGIIFAVGVSKSNGTSAVVNNEYAVDEFTNINIDISTADVELKPSEDGTRKVVLVEKEKQYHTVELKDNTLFVKSVDARAWNEKWFNFNYRPMKVTVYSPAGNYADVTINIATGDVTVPHDFTFNNLTVKSSTGDIHVKSNVINKIDLNASTGDVNVEAQAKNLNVKTSTGRIRLTNTLIEEHIQLKSSTGDIKVVDSDAKTLDVEASVGNINMVLLSGKTFEVNTSTGTKNYPDSTPGAGLCKVKTSTGDIKISIK